MARSSWNATQLGFAMLFIVFMAAMLASIGVTMTIQSPHARFELITVPTLPPTTTGPTTTTTTVPSTTTTTISTSTVVTTTSPYDPINITCPAASSVTLGFNFEPAFTGGFAFANGGCSTPAVTWTDTTLGFLAKKKRFEEEEPEHLPNLKWSPPYYAHVMDSQAGETSTSPTLLQNMETDLHGMLDAHGEGAAVELTSRNNAQAAGQKKKERPVAHKAQLRSPSFNTTNVVVLGTPLSVSNTGAIPPDSTAAVSSSHVVLGVNSASGSLITVTDKSNTFIASFTLSSLAGTLNCSGATRGDPQVMFDHEAQRWVLLELGVPSTNVLCVYLSDTADPLGNYSSFMYDFDPYFPDFPKIGLWRRAYLLTFNMQPLGPSDSPEDMCVIDREHMLNFVPTVNVTAPYMLCAASFLGRLSGFGFQAWTPISAEGGPMPPQETEAANAPGIGAVFMRHVDDEFHEAGGTPLVDFIEIEHWSNINWTAGTFSAQRYRVNVNDFDSSFSGCTASDECIPTPTAQELDPVREVINQRLSYRYIPQTGQESVVGTFTSHANGTATARVRWFELRWSTPNLMTVPKSWRLFQQGTLPFQDGVHRWMGAINMDGNGTITLCYSESNGSVYPSLQVVTRLGNDPLGMMRTPLLLDAGDVGSIIPSKRWGDYASVSIDPDSSRYFYVTGQRSSNTYPWVVSLTRLRVLGETVERIWKAQDMCGNVAMCSQIITAT